MDLVTGLSGAGKSTVADIVRAKLHARGARTFLLDGANVRHRLNRGWPTPTVWRTSAASPRSRR
jgi:adenylylsulfate kinase-like enzyme